MPSRISAVLLASLVAAVAIAQAQGAPDAATTAMATPEVEPVKPAPEGEAAPRKFAKVKVGAFINDIQSIDLKLHSYAVDLYVWFKWTDPDIDPADSVEFTNPSELWGHVRSKNFPEPVKLPTGELYQVLR